MDDRLGKKGFELIMTPDPVISGAASFWYSTTGSEEMNNKGR